MAKDAIGNPSSVSGNGAAATVPLVVAVLGDVNTEDANEPASSDEHLWTVGRQWIPGTRTQDQRANESAGKGLPRLSGPSYPFRTPAMSAPASRFRTYRYARETKASDHLSSPRDPAPKI